MSAEEDGKAALGALDRALAKRPERDGHAFTEVTKGLCAMRDQLIAQVRSGTGDQDRLGAKVIEQGSRGRCHEGGRAQDRGKHQTGGGRREAADLVQVDDLEREDQPIAEEVDGVPCLHDEYRAREVRSPTSS